MQEKCLISFYISSSSHHIGTSSPNKNIKQTLLHEVDRTKMDNSDNSKVHFKNCAIQDFQISSIPFIRNSRMGKVKNNLNFDMAQYGRVII